MLKAGFVLSYCHLADLAILPFSPNSNGFKYTTRIMPHKKMLFTGFGNVSIFGK